MFSYSSSLGIVFACYTTVLWIMTLDTVKVFMSEIQAPVQVFGKVLSVDKVRLLFRVVVKQALIVDRFTLALVILLTGTVLVQGHSADPTVLNDWVPFAFDLLPVKATGWPAADVLLVEREEGSWGFLALIKVELLMTTYCAHSQLKLVNIVFNFIWKCRSSIHKWTVDFLVNWFLRTRKRSSATCFMIVFNLAKFLHINVSLVSFECILHDKVLFKCWIIWWRMSTRTWHEIILFL